MNELDYKYLPYPQLMKHTDKILRRDEKWLVLDGIDLYGNPLHSDGLLTVYYHNHYYNVVLQISKEIYKKDYEYTWNFVRQRVATKITHLRKEAK